MSLQYFLPTPDYERSTDLYSQPSEPRPDYYSRGTTRPTTVSPQPTEPMPDYYRTIASEPLHVLQNKTRPDAMTSNVHTEVSRDISQKSPPITRHSNLLPPNSSFDQGVYIGRHSYKEDKIDDEPAYTRSTKEHIRQIGVPVLPGLTKHVFPKTGIYAAPISPEHNRAYQRHLENHRKFDTMKSLRGTADCPICQMMNPAGVSQNSRPRLDMAMDYDSNIPPAPYSDVKRIPDVRTIFTHYEEPPEPVAISQPKTARAKRDYEKKREGELRVNRMELVEVLQIEQEYALCKNKDSNIGWIPTSIIEFQ